MNESTGNPLRDWQCGEMGKTVPTLAESRRYCASLARRHYENFSVVTFLLPREVRQDFYNLYAYCRWADDLADETENSATWLDWWEGMLKQTYEDDLPPHPVFVALRETILQYAIPQKLLGDLLLAFRQDQIVQEYETRASLLEYCRYSANPVGRLILHLAGTTDETSGQLSDAICTGLQLANFWQDVRRDWDEKSRIYLPRQDRETFGVSDAFFRQEACSPAFRQLLQEETDWAETFFQAGSPLISRVPRSFQLDIALFNAGGLEILRAIRRQKYDVWTHRPHLSRWTKTRLLIQSLGRLFFRKAPVLC
ncbi:MAG: squalene synthase HpnC [Planctomycetia bacterium]|nr:squalene synthase HpnC [Planctomycetia bacterium]